MSDITLLLVGFSAFAAGVVCGTSVVGPKLYATVRGTLTQMSRDLNPRRDATLEGPASEPSSYFASRATLR